MNDQLLPLYEKVCGCRSDVCTDVLNAPTEGYPPRGFYTEATGSVRLLAVCKNPGHILPEIEASRYMGRSPIDIVREHLSFAEQTFRGKVELDATAARSTTFHKNMVRYLASLLETREADVFKHAAYTNLVKCSTQDEQGLLRGATMSECFKRHLRREIDFFNPVALVRDSNLYLDRTVSPICRAVSAG